LRKIVTHYAVSHDIGGATALVLYYQDGGADTVEGLGLEEAGWMIDLLRNEKPMAYDAEARRISTAAMEPVGEAE
jgi:hypothetical protein